MKISKLQVNLLIAAAGILLVTLYGIQSQNGISSLVHYLMGSNVSTEVSTKLSANRSFAVDTPRRPVLVTAFSSNHFGEAQAMFKTIHRHLPDHRVVAYDLGLTESEKERTRKHCQCELRALSWKQYPAHARSTRLSANLVLYFGSTRRYVTEWNEESKPNAEYTYVPLIHDHHSGWKRRLEKVRFISPDVEPLWNFAASNGFAASLDFHIVYCLTHPATFAALNVSQPEVFKHARTIQATFPLFTWHPETMKNIIAPWLQCALNSECIAPKGASPFGCQFQNSPSYCNCHRFDQSALEIILYQHIPGQFSFNSRDTPLAPFAFGTAEKLLPKYNALRVVREDASEYFPTL